MTNEDEKELPTVGQWYKRTNRGSAAAERYKQRPTDIVKIDDIEPTGDIVCLRFDGFDPSGAPIFGRRTTIQPKTWTRDTGRYERTHEPVPAMVDREDAIRRLRDLGADAPTIEETMANPRGALEHLQDRGFAVGASMEGSATMAILTAHVAYLNTMPVDAAPEPEKPIDPVAAEVRVLRAEVAALRASLDALTDALKKAVPQLALALAA